MGNGSFLRGWSAALASAVVLAIVASLLFTPVGAAVSDLLSVFRAEKFAPVTIDPSRPPTQAVGTDPRQFGEFELRTQPEHREVASVGEAQGLVDFPVRQLANGPAGLAAEPRIYVSSPLESVFTFDLAKTEATLAEVGVTAQLPAELDGATVRIYVPTNVQQMYVEADGTKSGLVLAQGRSPTLELPAILDTPQMRELFFTLSGLPPELVDQLRAITDTRTTVPVPVLEGDTSREVAVDGTQGLLVTHRPPTAGADAPEGSYLVWQKDGIVYALGGTVTEAELLAAAESLSP